MTTQPRYEARRLVKIYDKQKILEIDELEFGSKQFVALMGKNGSGKSTLMRLLAQHELFDAGSLTYAGTSLASPYLRLNPDLVFVAEDQLLPFSFTIGRWSEILERQNERFDRALFERLAKHLEVDLTKNFQALSRGQRMKTLFVLEAAKVPAVYLLDEITAVLDVGSRLYMMEFLKDEAARGCCVIMSTNIASEMQGFATDVVFIEKGAVVFRSSALELDRHFAKIRGSADRTQEPPGSLDARKVGFNADGRWSYVCKRKALTSTLSAPFEIDGREITLAEIQAYFTAGYME